MKKPQRIKASGISSDIRKAHNELVDFVLSLQPLEGHATQIDRTKGGFFIRPKSGSGSTSKSSEARWL